MPHKVLKEADIAVKEDKFIMKNKILKILKGTDGYISGENISAELSISRSMVWKYINRLRSEGYIISSVTNKGYKLEFSPDIINEEIIGEKLQTDIIGSKIVYIHETDSTNMLAKKFSDYRDGSVFIADTQTSGRGRLGRDWASLAGDGIYMSILLKPDISPEKVSQITLIAGLGVCMALRDFGRDFFIKWPNDVLAGKKKICGILTELSAETEKVNYIACGIGINVHNKNFPDELSEKAASVYTHTGKEIQRADIIASVLKYFEKYYKIYINEGIGKIIPEYKKLCITLDKEVKIIKDEKTITAKAEDIDEDGRLVIVSDGKRIPLLSGEVSVRGLLGYS